VSKIQKKNVAYAQVLEILNYMKIEDYFRIPRELICALEANKDETSTFKYNRERDFLEQNVIPEAKLILAIFFKRYWASDDQKSKIRVYEINKITAIEEEKKKIYPQNVISNKIVEEKLEEKRQNQLALIDEENWFKKFLSRIRRRIFASKK